MTESGAPPTDVELGLDRGKLVLPAALSCTLSLADAFVIRAGLERVALLTSSDLSTDALVRSRAFAGVVGLVVAHACLGLALGLLATRTTERFLVAVRGALLNRLDGSDPGRRDTDASRLATSLSFEVNQLRGFVDFVVTGLVRHVLALAALASVVAERGRGTLAPLALAFGLIGVVTLALARRSARSARAALDAESAHASRVLERVRTQDVRFVHRTESTRRPWYAEALATLARLRERLGSLSAASRPAVELSLAAALGAAWLVGSASGTGSGLSLAALAVAIRPIGALFSALQSIPLASAARDRIRRTSLALAPAARSRTVIDADGSLELSDVADGYDGVDVFEGLRAGVPPGELVVVTGANGSGKSTLLSSIAGARLPRRGRITLGGVPVRDAVFDDGRPAVGYLPQAVVLERGSVFGAVGVREGDEPALRAALASAGFEGSEVALSRASDAVGPDGAGLSVGQRAKLAIARALVHEPAMVVLDEPTNALDPASVASLVEALLDYAAKGRVVVVATHEPRVVGAATARFDLDDESPRLVVRNPRTGSARGRVA